MNRRAPRRAIAAAIGLAALASIVPLLVLTFLAIRLAGDAVRDEVRARASATAAGRSDAVGRELETLEKLVESYARRPSLVAAIRRGDAPAARSRIRLHLRELASAKTGIRIAFVARLDGRLVDIIPPTPSIVGKDFSFRDWYRGLTATGDTYVSEAYVTQAAGGGRVVGAATYVRNTAGDPLAILVGAYGLEHIQAFVDRFQATEGVHVTVTDQRGVIVATPGGAPRGLVSIGDDARVAAALAGESGVVDRAGADDADLSAFAPVAGAGWTVLASVPREVAFERVQTLRRAVLGIASALILVLLVGLAFFARTLSARIRAERETEEARDELESQNVELEHQTAELEEQQARLAEANDELHAQRAELERALGELAVEKERVEAFFTFGDRLAKVTDVDELAELVMREVGDFAGADAGLLYARDGEDGHAEAFVLTASRGLPRDAVPTELTAYSGAAGRALSEQRPVTVSYGSAGIEVPVLGHDMLVRHEIHLPLVQGGRCLGVLTLARLADEPFDDPETETLDHLAEQTAVALSNVISFRAASVAASVNRAVLDATPDAIALVDLDGRPIVDNESMRRLRDAESDPSESVYARIGEVAARTTDPEGVRSALEQCFADPQYATVLTLEATDTGQAFQLYTAPVRENGEPVARIFVLHDITAEREAERLKSELLATVSHELRTPLASILGFSELLSVRDVDEDSRRRFVATIHREARRLTDLINDFLDLQRIEEGRFTLDLQRFDLRGLVAEQAEVFAGQSREHTLSFRLPDEPIEVLGDRDRISQVVANLVSNAIKYSPGGGEVVISADGSNGYARIAVSDSGLGIPEDQQARIFSKFFRVDSSDTREIGGTGLGLALSREIVQSHGGRIGFSSVEGEGSTFWFELPVGPAARATTTRVLVVEDDRAASELLRAALSGDGFAIEVAATGEEALERVRADPPALVCLDIGLAGELDGWDVLERLKADPATEHVPVVVCTSADGRRRAGALGAADFVAKPFSPDLLRDVVRRVLPENRGRVLVVDDEVEVRRLVFETLGGDGLELREATDGVEALEAMDAEPPDAVVLDLMMPRLDGFAVLERMQGDRRLRAIPVIVLTARRLSGDERRLLQQRMVSLLEKSTYSGAELKRLVASALGTTG